MRLSIDLPSGRSLVTDVDEAHAACGRELLGRLVPPAAALPDGAAMEVELDWATVRLRANAEEVVAEEPDYPLDPSRTKPSLSITSQVFDLQRQVLQMVGGAGEAVTAGQYIRVSQDGMDSVTVVGFRHQEDEPIFSGWQLVSPGSIAQNEVFGLYTARELAAHRLVWIVALVLAAGWSFRCVGNTLVDAVSPAGQTYTVQASLDLPG